MKVTTIDDILEPLKKKKKYFHEQFGVKRIGVFGSFVHGSQNDLSDIDIVIDMEKDKKNLHNFLEVKRILEEEFQRPVDLGLEHTLKPVIREKLKGKIVYA